MHANVVFAGLALALAALFLGTSEVGFWVGRRAAPRSHPKAFDNAMAWQGAVLGLAALLIGFTFAMAASRFDSRKQILVAEADAIGTAYHDTRLLDEKLGDPLRALMRRYVDLRIELYDAHDPAHIEATESASAAVREQLWSRLAAFGRSEPHSVMAGLALQSTAGMFERAAERQATREMPVPPTVFAVVILVAAFGVASIGYALGLIGARLWFGMRVIPVLVACVIMLVINIAEPSLGIVGVPNVPMLRLRQALSSPGL